MTPATTRRPRIGWIKRRARQIERTFAVHRKVAVVEAAHDYAAAHGMRLRPFLVANGGGA